jgi:hypothetical protein
MFNFFIQVSEKKVASLIHADSWTMTVLSAGSTIFA